MGKRRPLLKVVALAFWRYLLIKLVIALVISKNPMLTIDDSIELNCFGT